MPAIVKVKVIEGKDLPIMDRASDLTDAFVELRLGGTTFKTDVCRKSLNPQWNSDWYKFEVDDEEIQEEYLQIKVLDHDVYSSHDAIGKVTINLDTNIVQNGTKELSGYYPIYDTLHGIRGYIKLKIRIQFFIDANKYRQTSCGIKFFSSSGVPHGCTAIHYQGFVEELLVDDDPEYQWIEKIRTSRASNEARQRHISKLSGFFEKAFPFGGNFESREVRRKIGLKVLEVGGNAVIGYHQQFDLEGETGIVVRGIGTAVTLTSDTDNAGMFTPQPLCVQSPEQHVPSTGDLLSGRGHRLSQMHPSPHGIPIPSEGDFSNERTDATDARVLPIRTRNYGYTEDIEFPFFTINCPPSDFVLHLGGVVSSRSVKLLDKINNPDESETRDGWWNELRIEIRSHMKAMGCSAVIGYTESTTICDDLIILTAYGTAAVVVTQPHQPADEQTTDLTDGCGESDSEIKDSSSDDKKPLLKQEEIDGCLEETSPANANHSNIYSSLPGCHMCHVPYSDVELPLPVALSKCMFCRQDNVPDILLSTTDIPEELPVIGTGSLLQSRVVRVKKKEKGESNAEIVSQILPFLEFDLHQQLINKLKVKGMNAVFGMKSKLSISEQLIVAVTTGTAVYIAALPSPPMIVLTGRSDPQKEKDEFSDLQKRLMAITKRNKKFYNLTDIQDYQKHHEENNDIKEMKNRKLDLLVDGKESYVFELDDKSDACIHYLMNETNFEGFHVFNTQATPGIPLFKNNQKLLCIFRHLKIPSSTDDEGKLSQWISSICDNSLLSMRLKTRAMHPCALTRVSFDTEITDDDYFQLTLSCFALTYNDCFNKHPLCKQMNLSRSLSTHSSNSRSLDEVERNEHVKAGVSIGKLAKPIKPVATPLASTWPSNRLSLLIDRDFSEEKPTYRRPVLITPLMRTPNVEIKSYLGNVNLFLIRESTDLKEAQCLINVSGDVAETRADSDTGSNIFCDVTSSSKGSSMENSPITPDKAEWIFKLDRAVYGTNV